MDDQYGLSGNLGQYINGRQVYTPVQPPPDILSNHHNLAATHHYDNIVMMSHQRPVDLLSHGLHSDSTTNTGVSAGGGFGGLDIDGGGLGSEGGSARWPRQETLSLLEIRSRLDAKFKEVNQKGPLWDEVSRIMYEEHGYQRSGKKCREKFENLYKYYKKTKEGKAGRQDGKHYRFFRQLEALYGETTTNNNNNNNNCSQPSTSNNHLVAGTTSFRYNSNIFISNNNNQEFFSHDQASKQSEENSLISLSNSCDFETTSSEDSEGNHDHENSSSIGKRKKRSKKGWKRKIKDFIDAQMRKLMVKQEAWLDKMMKTIEHKEQERMVREETWKKQEEERIEKEHKFWDKERAWIEARDAALMEALHKLPSREIILNDNASETITNLAIRGGESSWQECEITRLIQLRNGMETRFVQQVGWGEMIWEEIAAKMASFGYARSPSMCKNKWGSINDYLIKCQKKGKESSASCGGYFQGNDHHSICHQVGGAYCDNNNETPPTTSSSRGGGGININDHGNGGGGGGNSPPNYSTGLNTNDNCFRYFMGDAGNNLWENYGMKLPKGDNN